MKKARGIACPYCSIPRRNRRLLLAHFVEKHGWDEWYCVCGATFTSNREFVAHLAGIRDLTVHIAAAALAASATSGKS